jgi:hypothetical protein
MEQMESEAGKRRVVEVASGQTVGGGRGNENRRRNQKASEQKNPKIRRLQNMEFFQSNPDRLPPYGLLSIPLAPLPPPPPPPENVLWRLDNKNNKIATKKQQNIVFYLFSLI